MKTKCVVAAVAVAFAMLSATAKGSKHYSNSAGGYSGWAGAEYRGTTETYDLSYYDTGDLIYDVVEGDVKKSFEEQGYVITKPLSKMSKEEEFLIWKALGEYDIEDGKVYGGIVQRKNSDESLGLDVENCDNGRSVRDYGGIYFKDK